MDLNYSPNRKLRHSRFGSDPEICLFVPNRRDKFDYKISVDESIEITIDYYTNFLRKHKVEGIKTVRVTVILNFFTLKLLLLLHFSLAF